MGIDGLEMLKALRGITTHEARLELRVYPNTQDMEALAQSVEARCGAPRAELGLPPLRPRALRVGATPAEAWRHAEALDFVLTIRMHEEGFTR